MTEALDEPYLSAYASAQQREAYDRHAHGGERCAACTHSFHGLKCQSCQCPTAWQETAA